MAIEDLDQKFLSTVDQLQELWNQATEQLTMRTDELQDNYETLQEEHKRLQEDYNEAQAKIDKIEGQLQNTVEQLEEMSGATEKGVDAMQLLDVYLVLMESVFESQAHTRLLLMLHGEKDEYTLNDLSTAAGISALKVKQALFDLRNSGVIEYDEETQIAELKTRFM